MTSTDYPVILALEDFVPVILAFAGFWLLSQQRLGRAGAILLGLGGLAKAVWKLLVAGWGIDLPWLEGALFPLMAIGGALLASALHRKLSWPTWPYLALAGLAALSMVLFGSLQPAFILATTLVVAISILAAVIAWRHGATFAALLYPVSVLVVIALVPLRHQAGSETVIFQWAQQLTNTIAQALFFAASLIAWRAVQKGSADD